MDDGRTRNLQSFSDTVSIELGYLYENNCRWIMLDGIKNHEYDVCFHFLYQDEIRLAIIVEMSEIVIKKLKT